MVRNTMGLIDEQAKLARGLGGSTAALQALDRAAGRAGVSSGELQSATLRLNQRLGQAVIEGGAAADALQRIGLRADDLIKMDIDERMASLSDAMRDAGLNSQEMAFTLRELGIRQSAIVNLMQEGGEAIRESRQAVEDFGLAVSEVDAAAIERANDAVDEIGIAITGVRNRIAVELSPVITQIAEHISGRFREAGQDMSDAIGRAADFAIRKFADVLDGAASVVEFITQNPTMAQFGLLGFVLLGPKGAMLGGIIGAAFDQIKVRLEEFGVTLSDAEFQGQRLASMEQDLARTTEVVSRALEQRSKITDAAERAEFSRAIGLQEMIDKEAELKDEIEALRGEVDGNEESMSQFDKAMARAEGTTSSLANEMRGVAGAIREAREASDGAEAVGGTVGLGGSFFDPGDEEAAAERESARQEELERLAEWLEQRREMLVHDSMDQMELARHKHEEDLEMLRMAFENQVLEREEYLEMIEVMEAQHNEKMRGMYERDAEARKRSEERVSNDIIAMKRGVAMQAANLLGTMAQDSRAAAIAQIALNKGLAIAQIIQNTSVAQMRAMAELGPIAGPPAAARIGVMGKIQAGIAAATGLAQAAGAGGGGGAASGSGVSSVSQGGAGSASEAAQQQQAAPIGGTLTVEGISSSALFSGDAVRELAEELIEFQRRGGSITIA